MSQEDQMDEAVKKKVSLNSKDFKFKENKFMTKYEGYWIQKSRVRFVNAMYYKFHRKVASNKHVVTDDQKQGKLNRCMKKLLRNEHRMLKMEMAKVKNKPVSGDEEVSNKPVPGVEISKKPVPRDEISKKPVPRDKISKKLKKSVVPTDELTKKPVPTDELTKKPVPTDELTKKPVPKDGLSKKPGKYIGINYKDDPDIVMYEGFCIHKRSTDRLNKVKEELTQKGLSAENLRKELRKECRKEERLVKREKKRKILQPKMDVQPNTHVQPKTYMQPKTHVQPKTNTSIQPRTYVQPKTNTSIHPRTYVEPNTLTKPKTHVVFED